MTKFAAGPLHGQTNLSALLLRMANESRFFEYFGWVTRWLLLALEQAAKNSFFRVKYWFLTI
jgi:hypothetical protein